MDSLTNLQTMLFVRESNVNKGGRYKAEDLPASEIFHQEENKIFQNFTNIINPLMPDGT